ncbi:MAG: DUF167 domain-containing protein [Pseudomonadota bacterium]
MKIDLKVIPCSSREFIVGWLGERLKVKVRAPPEAGKANKAVIKLLASALNLSTDDIRIVSGSTSAQKVVEITGIDASLVHEKLAAFTRGRAGACT